MPLLSHLILNLNVCRIMTAMAVVLLGSSNSPLWWTAAIPWFFFNLPGLLLFTFPAFALFLSSPGILPVDWMHGPFPLILAIGLPTSISMILSYCWRPLFRKTGALSQFDYPGA